MAQKEYREKEEKEEKRTEKEEKGREEKWRSDPINAVTWAAVLVWLGLVLLARTTGFMDGFDWFETWPVFLLGWGAIMLIQAVARGLMPGQRWWAPGSLIFGFILIGVGLGWLFSWGYVAPVVLFAIAATILFSAFVKKK
jgi:hypothetical protein